jgi:hypothetical protein
MNRKEKEKTIFRSYTASDKEQLLQLYERVWGKEKADNIALIWDWKFHKHPDIAKEDYHSLVVEKGGQIIGFIGTIPTKIKVGQNVYDGFALGDHMIDPKHRGRMGLYLAKAMIGRESTVIGHADSGKYEDKISRRLWSKVLGTKNDVTYVNNMIKRLSIESAVKRHLKIRSLAALADWAWRRIHDMMFWLRNGRSVKSDLVIEEIDHFSEETRPFLNELMEQNENIILRTMENMNWRVFERPGTKYTVLLAKRGDKPAGFIVLRTIKNHNKLNGRIVEFMAKKEDSDCFNLLMKTAINIFLKEKAIFVQAYGSPSFSKNKLQRAGFSNRKVKHPTYPILGDCPDENLFNHDAWHMSLLDSDFDMD